MRPHHFGLLHLLLALTVAQNVSQTQQTSTQNATQAQPAVLASPPPLDDLAGCPQWLFDYIRWHKQQRENTSAWRLTWTDENTKGTAGFGDRLRGVVFNVRAAASSDRRAGLMSAAGAATFACADRHAWCSARSISAEHQPVDNAGSVTSCGTRPSASTGSSRPTTSTGGPSPGWTRSRRGSSRLM